VAVLRKYAVVKGRARRKEYWMYILINYLLMNVLVLLGWSLGFRSPADKNVLLHWYALVALSRLTSEASILVS
jgi:uncharacterized membrane protein YhaH (DUF805 family)